MRYQREVLAAIFRLARSRGLQEADAREVVQEVCLAVSRAIDRYEPRQSRHSFRSWLATITRNRTLNLLRRTTALPRSINSGGPDAVGLSAIVDYRDPRESLDRRFDHEHRRQLFLWAAERLKDRFSPANWQAFWRTCVEGEEIQDVASELGVPISKIHIARCRIIARIRELVQRHSLAEDLS